MDRETTRSEILTLDCNYLLIQLPTGYGKTKVALDYINKVNPKRVLIVVPYRTLFTNWLEEIKKWGYTNINVTFSTYRSLHKHTETSWDAIIYDECHHLSENAIQFAEVLQAKKTVFLSATVNKTVRDRMRDAFPYIKGYRVSMRKAIENEVLPDPIIYLHPLILGDEKTSFLLHPKAKGKVIVSDFKSKAYYDKVYKNNVIKVECTQKEHIEYLDSQIEYWKNRFFMTKQIYMKNKWLQLCTERLKALSKYKEPYIIKVLKEVDNYRTLTFCSSIEQAEKLGEYCIHSKNKELSNKNLEDFNNHKINHLTACAMLDEGINLVDCQMGIYANLSSSDRLIKQRLGRILRHKNPFIYLPYFKGTRDEEIKNKMLEDYNPDNIKLYTSSSSK